MLKEEGQRIFPDDGVITFPDDTLPNKVYYTKQMPSLALRKDNTYVFNLIGLYPPTSDYAGTLSLQMDLAVPDDALQRIKRQLGPDTQLEPIPWMSGNTTLALASPTRTFNTRPTLLGNNTALFSISLNLEEFNFIQAALKNNNPQIGDPTFIPFGVVYDLTYTAMRQALQCTVTMDWNKFEHWRKTKCQAHLLFVNVSVTNIVDELQDSQIVSIECVQRDDESAVKEQLGKLLMDAFFTPMPTFKKPDSSDNGSGWGLGFSCKTEEYTQIAKSFLDLQMNVNKAVSKRMVLQGEIGELHKDLSQQLISFSTISSDGPRTQTLALYLNADFHTDQIERITLSILNSNGTLTKNTNVENPLTLTTSTQSSFNLTYTQDQPPYKYQYTTHFRQSTPPRQPITSPILTLSKADTFLSISPRDNYTQQSIPLSTGTQFPWTLIQQTIIEIKTPGQQNSDTRVLTPDKTDASWELFTPTPNTFDFKYRARYTTKSNGTIQSTWEVGENLIYLDPFAKRELTFSTQHLDWTLYKLITVQIQQQEGALYEQSILSFSSKNQQQTILSYTTDQAQKETNFTTTYISNAGEKQAITQTTKDTLVYINPPPEDTPQQIPS